MKVLNSLSSCGAAETRRHRQRQFTAMPSAAALSARRSKTSVGGWAGAIGAAPLAHCVAMPR